MRGGEALIWQDKRAAPGWICALPELPSLENPPSPAQPRQELLLHLEPLCRKEFWHIPSQKQFPPRAQLSISCSSQHTFITGGRSCSFPPQLEEKCCCFWSWELGTQELGGWVGEGSRCEIITTVHLKTDVQSTTGTACSPNCSPRLSGQALSSPGTFQRDASPDLVLPCSACAARPLLAPSGAVESPQQLQHHPSLAQLPLQTPLHTQSTVKTFLLGGKKDKTGSSVAVPPGAHTMGCYRPRVTSR